MANVYLRALREMADAQELCDEGKITREALQEFMEATEIAFFEHQKELATIDSQAKKEGAKP